MIYIFVLLIIVLNILDIVTTARILKAGGIEKNVVIAWIMKKTNKWWIAIKIVMIAAVIGSIMVYQFLTVSVLTTLFYLWVVVNNVRVMRQMGLSFAKRRIP